jgi:ubiquinone/menaquinone biosynthesis C-methylase UbiE
VDETSPLAGVFGEMGVYWAEIADKNSTTKQVTFLKSVLKKEGLILDLCCGTARHSILLSREGYYMVGLDVSARLLAIARKKAAEAQVNLPLVRCDMRCLPFKPKVFSAVISMDTSFGYLQSDHEDTQSLAETKRVLAADGLFLIDVFNRERLIRSYRKKQEQRLHNGSTRFEEETLSKKDFPPLIRSFVTPLYFRLSGWKEYPSFYMLQNRMLDDKGETVHDSWLIYDKKTGETRFFRHVVRLYSLELLQSLLHKAGLQVEKVYGDYEMQKFSSDSSRLIIAARRHTG